MSDPHSYLRRLRALAARVEDVLTPQQHAVVEDLIEHGEGGEAMLTLAWALVDDRNSVPLSVIAEIRALAEGLVDAKDFPPNLDQCATATDEDR